MNDQVAYEAKDSYLRVRVSAPYDPPVHRELLRGVREKALQCGYTRLLLDGTDVPAAPSDIDRYLLGEIFADLFPPPFKVAVVYPLQSDKFTENTAVVRGANILICRDEAEAVSWLLANNSP